MTQDGIPVIVGVIEQDTTARVAEAAKAASVEKGVASSLGNASENCENLKMFTMDDMVKALAEQTHVMEASFAKDKVSGPVPQMSSGKAQRSPQAAYVYPGSEYPMQRGGTY